MVNFQESSQLKQTDTPCCRLLNKQLMISSNISRVLIKKTKKPTYSCKSTMILRKKVLIKYIGNGISIFKLILIFSLHYRIYLNRNIKYTLSLLYSLILQNIKILSLMNKTLQIKEYKQVVYWLMSNKVKKVVLLLVLNLTKIKNLHSYKKYSYSNG